MRIETTTINNLWISVDKKKLEIVNACNLSKEKIINNLNRLYIRELLLETKKENTKEENKKTLVPGITITYEESNGHKMIDYKGFIQSVFCGILGEFDGHTIYFNTDETRKDGVYFSFTKNNDSFIELERIWSKQMLGNKNVMRCRSMIFTTPFPVIKTYEKDKELIELINKNTKE